MTWTKLSDDFSDDCWTLSDAAYRLHTEGLVWSNRKLLGGQLSKEELRRWAKRPEAADELVAAGWWEDEGDHYRIIHHARYQRPLEQVLKQQERNWKNGQSGGRPKGPPREQAPRKRPKETQMETHLGSDGSDSVDEKPRWQPTWVTQMETQLATHRDGTGRDKDRTGLDRNRGTSLSAEAEKKGDANGQAMCADCGERPASGLGWDPTLCRRCLDDRVGDAAEDAP
jgi:hypothetical protein